MKKISYETPPKYPVCDGPRCDGPRSTVHDATVISLLPWPWRMTRPRMTSFVIQSGPIVILRRACLYSPHVFTHQVYLDSPGPPRCACPCLLRCARPWSSALCVSLSSALCVSPILCSPRKVLGIHIHTAVTALAPECRRGKSSTYIYIRTRKVLGIRI
jgi:hypothetical protein